MSDALQQLFERVPGLQCLLVKMGKMGSAMVTRDRDVTTTTRNSSTELDDGNDDGGRHSYSYEKFDPLPLLCVRYVHAPKVLDNAIVSASGSGDW